MKALKRIKDLVLRLSVAVSLFTILFCCGRIEIGKTEMIASGIAFVWLLLMFYANE